MSKFLLFRSFLNMQIKDLCVIALRKKRGKNLCPSIWQRWQYQSRLTGSFQWGVICAHTIGLLRFVFPVETPFGSWDFFSPYVTTMKWCSGSLIGTNSRPVFWRCVQGRWFLGWSYVFHFFLGTEASSSLGIIFWSSWLCSEAQSSHVYFSSDEAYFGSFLKVKCASTFC